MEDSAPARRGILPLGALLSRKRVAALALALLAGCGARDCGGLGGRPPESTPSIIRGPDGREYYLLERGRFKAYYDAWGRLQRIEYDSNGDGRPDIIAYHDGAKLPHLLEIDEDFDGRVDRWEEYDQTGHLMKVGTSRRGQDRPDMWVFPGPDGLPVRKEYDDNGDGVVDRVEVYRDGRLVRVELDTDGDGRIDRWQDWQDGRIVSEEVDTDGDGQPDRRIVYDDRGKILRTESLTHGR